MLSCFYCCCLKTMKLIRENCRLIWFEHIYELLLLRYSQVRAMKIFFKTLVEASQAWFFFFFLRETWTPRLIETRYVRRGIPNNSQNILTINELITHGDALSLLPRFHFHGIYDCETSMHTHTRIVCISCGHLERIKYL